MGEKPRPACACGNPAKRQRSRGYTFWRQKCSACLKVPKHSRADACEACGYRPVTPELLEVDHVLPRSRGGDNSPENLQTLCANCHKIKTLLDRKPDHEMRPLLLAEGLRLVTAERGDAALAS